MNEQFFDDSHAEALWNAAEDLAERSRTNDAQADAMDRLTIALYRIGAVIASRMDSTARGVNFLAETLRDETLHLKQED